MDDNILDWSISKAMADDRINLCCMELNTLFEKGENVDFLMVFRKAFVLKVVKNKRLFGKRFNQSIELI